MIRRWIKTNGTIEELTDARNLTNEQAIEYLLQAKKGLLKGHSYIPVRKDTPQVIIDILENAGEVKGIGREQLHKNIAF